MNSKILVIYYSLEGNTKDTAEKIADQMGADMLQLLPVHEYPKEGAKKFLVGGKAAVFGEKPELRVSEFDLTPYEMIIVGTPVWASTFAPPLRTFFTKNKITNQKTGFFVCEKGSGGEKCIAKMKELTGVSAIAAQMILIDPLQNPKPENEKTIEEFCRTLKK